jgi:hypothetical protein
VTTKQSNLLMMMMMTMMLLMMMTMMTMWKSCRRRRKARPRASSKKGKALSGKSLVKRLGVLTSAQLSSLIATFIEAGKLSVADVEAALPRADVASMQEKILKAWRAMRRAYPNSRFGRSDDEFCFKRVRPALPPLKAAVKEAFEAMAVSHAYADIVTMTVWVFDNCPFPNTGAFRVSRLLCDNAQVHRRASAHCNLEALGAGCAMGDHPGDCARDRRRQAQGRDRKAHR